VPYPRPRGPVWNTSPTFDVWFNTLTATDMDHCKAVVSISFDDNQDHDDGDNES